MKELVGGFEFDSDFDSGNLLKIKIDDDARCDSNCTAFIGWTKPDCHGTENETTMRTWFYFGIRNAKPNAAIQITLQDLNRQGKLFSQGHAPVVRIQQEGSKPGRWQRTCSVIDYNTEKDEEFYFTFTYKFDAKTTSTTTAYFAFCIPFSYEEQQQQLAVLDSRFSTPHTTKDPEPDSESTSLSLSSLSLSQQSSPPPPPPPQSASASDIYYRRELIIRSCDDLRVDLLTISDTSGITSELEPRYNGLFPDKQTPRAHKFTDKKVFVLTSRVHPGETPASHVFNGFLDFILDKDDPRARALRQQFVFKMIPMLNPDGVKRGHYRSDIHGLNLNRFYHNPNINVHPSIFASRAMVLHHHQMGNLEFYLDLHAHAAKRGCFIYGNALETSRQVDNVTYARLIAMNSPHFDFKGCSFSEKNMFSRDKRDGMSKEGSGRVGVFLATNITHIYTLECNYNTGRTMNALAQTSGDNGLAEKAPLATTPPPYTSAIYEDVGKACALAALDLRERNPWSRIPNTEFGSLAEVKKEILQCIRSSRMRRGNNPTAMPRQVAVALRQKQAANTTTNTTTNSGGVRGSPHPRSHPMTTPKPPPSSSSTLSSVHQLSSRTKLDPLISSSSTGRTHPTNNGKPKLTPMTSISSSAASSPPPSSSTSPPPRSRPSGRPTTGRKKSAKKRIDATSTSRVHPIPKPPRTPRKLTIRTPVVLKTTTTSGLGLQSTTSTIPTTPTTTRSLSSITATRSTRSSRKRAARTGGHVMVVKYDVRATSTTEPTTSKTPTGSSTTGKYRIHPVGVPT